jgi:hypothetical protein
MILAYPYFHSEVRKNTDQILDIFEFIHKKENVRLIMSQSFTD